MDISQNTELTDLSSYYCLLHSTFDISDHTNLKKLVLAGTPTIEKLDLSSHVSLQSIDFNLPDLTEIHLPEGNSLEMLNIYSKKLEELSVPRNGNLKEVTVRGEKLSSLEFSECPSVMTVNISSSGQLAYLDISRCAGLRELYCNQGKLSRLDISSNKQLTTLYCNMNQITGLDISSNPELQYLYCGNNLFTELDISTSKNLKYLEFGSYNHPTTVWVWEGFDLLTPTNSLGMEYGAERYMTFKLK